LRGIEAATDLAKAVRDGEHEQVHARHLIAALDDAMADLAACRAQVTQAIWRAHCDTDDGHVGPAHGPGGATTRTDDDGHPVDVRDYAVGERVASNIDRGEDQIRVSRRHAVEAIAGARGMAALALRSTSALLPMSRERADSILRAELASGTAICANRNCQRVVMCTARDRLIAGRCRRCYEYLSTSRKTGRMPEERPRELCDNDDPAVERKGGAGSGRTTPHPASGLAS
jgi:hypothetical protein